MGGTLRSFNVCNTREVRTPLCLGDKGKCIAVGTVRDQIVKLKSIMEM